MNEFQIQGLIIKAKKVKVGPIEASMHLVNSLLYWHMHVNYFAFKSQGKKFFHSRDTLAESLNVSPATVKRSLAELEDIGLIAKKIERIGPKKTRNIYAVLHYTLALWDDAKIDGELPLGAMYDDNFEESTESLNDEEYIESLMHNNSSDKTKSKDDIKLLVESKYKEFFNKIDEKDVPY